MPEPSYLCGLCGTRVTVVDCLRREHGTSHLHTADRCRAYRAAAGQTTRN